MKLLINHPDLSYIGGVANHYLGLRRYWTADVHYNTVGKRKAFQHLTFPIMLWDVFKFILKLFFYRPDAIILNPSLGARALKRDFLFSRIARWLDYPVVIFLHGFDLTYAQGVDREWLSRNLNHAALIFVLASTFRDILNSWGVTSPIALTTTKVDNDLLHPIPTGSCINKSERISHLLFLARIDRAKGIYESIDTFCLLAKKYADLTLSIVGDGEELESVRHYVSKQRFKDRITICGALRGKALQEAYLNAQLYILPSYGEGMPTSVLEAMAFGLPVFTRNVGGLIDFFNERMGYMTDSTDPTDFASAIEPYLNNINLYQSVSEYNRRYAQEHFMASQVALDIENSISKHL